MGMYTLNDIKEDLNRPCLFTGIVDKDVNFVFQKLQYEMRQQQNKANSILNEWNAASSQRYTDIKPQQISRFHRLQWYIQGSKNNNFSFLKGHMSDQVSILVQQNRNEVGCLFNYYF